MEENTLAFFENFKIRKIYDEDSETWYFSVIDIIQALILRFGASVRSAWWAGVKSGKYPKPVKLSDRCTCWRVEDIRALLAQMGQP